MSTRIAVVGGGITGLAAAYEARRQQADAEIVVYEATDRFGGKVSTTEFAGRAIDEGADAFLARVPWGLELCQELGIDTQLVSPAEQAAYVWFDGELRRLPAGLVLGVPTDFDALAASGIVREPVEVHPADAPLAPDRDVSVGQLVRRQLGDAVFERLVDPLLGGINAGNADRLSVRAGAPQLAAAAERDANLIEALKAQPAATSGPVFYCPVGGMGALVDALIAFLTSSGVQLEGESPIDSITALDADRIVVTVPSYEAAELVRAGAPAAATFLDTIGYASVALVAMAFPQSAITRPLDASGFLVPRTEGLLMTATSWTSSKWAHLNGDTTLVRVSAGKYGEDRIAELDDDELVRVLLEEVAATSELRGEPDEVRVTRWPRSFPQYEPGHLDRVGHVEQLIATALPHVILAGAAFRGLGVPACIRQGLEAARELLGAMIRVVGRAALAGLLLAASLPPWGWWPLAFVGLALLDRLIADQPASTRFRRGWLVAAWLLFPTLSWLISFTLPGYVIAASYYSAIFGLACMACPPTAPARWIALPGAWVLAEAFRERWPFGGVPVSRLAMGQVDTPLVNVARVGGPLLLDLVAVVVGVALAAALARHRRAAGAAIAFVALLVVVGLVAPHGHDIGSLRIAAVQGGGPQGTRFFDEEAQRVYERHLDASNLVQPPVDVVLWPENVVNIEGRITNSDVGQELSDLARRLHTTLLVGVVEGDGNRFHNGQVAIDPSGNYIDRYEKVHRVPFGEYVPLRWLLEPFAGDSLIRRDALDGRDPAILHTPAGTFGVAISWEIFFADRARAAIRQGGEVLLNPTNGASFHGSIIQSQQIASSRLRAIETGRWVVQAAPTGFSAVITPSGHVVTRTGISEQRVLEETVQRRTGLTWATRLGDWPPLILAGLAIAYGHVTARGGWSRARRSPAQPASLSETDH